MKNILFLSLLILLSIQTTSAQSYMPKTNRKNSQHQRIGVWNLTNGYRNFQVIYMDGHRTRSCKEMDRNGYLHTVGRYSYFGSLADSWFHFDKIGRIEYTIGQITNSNQLLFDTADGTLTAPALICTYMEYYPSGQLRKEGNLLFEVGTFPLDKSSRPYGIWKWYTPDGQLEHAVCFLFSWLYSVPEHLDWTMKYDYNWALQDEDIKLPWIE